MCGTVGSGNFVDIDDRCTGSMFYMYIHTTIYTLQCRPTQQCILRSLKLLEELKEIHKSLPEGASLEGDTKEKVEGIKVKLATVHVQ